MRHAVATFFCYTAILREFNLCLEKLLDDRACIFTSALAQTIERFRTTFTANGRNDHLAICILCLPLAVLSS